MGQGNNLADTCHRHHSRALFLYTASSSKVCSHRPLGSKIQIRWGCRATGGGCGRLNTQVMVLILVLYCPSLAPVPIDYTSVDRPLLCTNISWCLHVCMCMLWVLHSACSDRQEYSCLSLLLLSMVHHVQTQEPPVPLPWVMSDGWTCGNSCNITVEIETSKTSKCEMRHDWCTVSVPFWLVASEILQSSAPQVTPTSCFVRNSFLKLMSSVTSVPRPTEITIPILTVIPLADPRFLRYNERLKKIS